MRYLYFIIFFSLLGTKITAQEILVPPEAKFITKLPIKLYSGGVMVIRAKLDSIEEELNFILDTGSSGISLDSSTCVEFGIPTVRTDTIITGIGGGHKVNYVFDKTLNFQGLTVQHLNFHINNYEVLTSVYGEKIDGIIGYSFLSRYIVKINFDSLHLEVFTRGTIKYPEGGTLLHPIFTALPIQYLQIKDRKKTGYNFYFDTGAGLCFLMNDKYVEDSMILSKKRKPVVTGAEGMMGKLRMRLTVIKELKIGPYRFRAVPTYLYKDDYNVTNYPFVGGLIGNDLLRRFNLILNYGQRELHLIPNSHFNEAFDYSYTGLNIYQNDGRIMVEDVIKNSPAEKAGFKVDDEIIGVGTNMTFNIQAYKNALQVAGEKIKVIIKRNENLQTLIIVPTSILN